ncbi:hypothetical protein HYH03_002126 [Edaphochlamys debaryana]|uniref:Uncharacterized protein n=1 Tax=Edaphochlamys debaryana TaxID=47281 RepID=A0A835YJQ1_9CHLO|nr:hypothetical protein HYH03_002126 [Edaphochlamys debaryana]|eukprot:KAG2499835.1 hypothetical protein HYH03_002126 [Edaphochlamys debaryana]
MAARARGLGERSDAEFEKKQLRFHLSVSDGTAPAYWKIDGGRFAGKGDGGRRLDWRTLCSGSTLKLCEGKPYQLSLTANQPVYIRAGSGCWFAHEVDPKADVGPAPLPAEGLASLAAAFHAAAEGKPVGGAGDPDDPAETDSHPLGPEAPGTAAFGTGPAGPPGISRVGTSTRPAPTPPWRPWSRDGPGPAGGTRAEGAALLAPGPGPSFAPGLGLPPPLAAALAKPGAQAGEDGVGLGVEPLAGANLAWADASVDATRSTFKAPLLCSLEATDSKKRLYMQIVAYVEEFGWVVCPLQIKVYHRADRSLMQTYPLKFVQYDLRGDSSDTAALVAVNFHRY